MNTAARLLNQHSLSHTVSIPLLLTKTQLLFGGLFTALMLSALSMVFVTHLTCNLNASLQQGLEERATLQTQWNQLLLEKSTWMTEARVQRVAQKDLGMIVPEAKSVVAVTRD